MSGMSSRLRGQVALITGASSGIGRATALLFAREGARVVATARREDRLRALVDEIHAEGGEAVWHAGDAGEEQTAETAVALALEHFSQLDLLVNNAGAGSYKSLLETTAAEFDDLLRTNLRSGFLFSRCAVREMVPRRSGTILFVSSVAGLQGAANEAVYSATKFAQVGFSQSLDAELRPHGIRVGVLCPGGVKSEFALGRGRTAEGIVASQMMEPESVAEAILFACTQPANTRIPQMTVRHMG